MSSRIRVAAGTRINGQQKYSVAEQLKAAAQSAPTQRKAAQR